MKALLLRECGSCDEKRIEATMTVLEVELLLDGKGKRSGRVWQALKDELSAVLAQARRQASKESK